MITNEDMKRLQLPELTPDQIRRITNAETTCKNSLTDWSKNYWFEVLRKLCVKYGALEYFRKVLH